MIAQQEEKRWYEGFDLRLAILGFGLVAALTILVLRLWQLQVVDGAYYQELAISLRLHPQRLKAPRGIIYGQNTSVLLADNRPSCDLIMVPAECIGQTPEDVCQRLQDLVGVDKDELLKRISDNRRQPFKQIEVKRDLSKSQLTRVEENAYLLPGVFTLVRPQRRYPQGPIAGQIVGYINEAGQKDLEQGGYEYGDFVGRSGLERAYEDALRGTDGRMVVNVYASDQRPELRTDAYGRPFFEVDSRGRSLTEEPEFRLDPTPGQHLFIGLDLELQSFAEGLLRDVSGSQAGAIAVLNADTGQVLAVASYPIYDPTVFVRNERSVEREDLFRERPNKMSNRCYRETYPPGSTFKVMLAVAALEEQAINDHSSWFCPGYFQLPQSKNTWRCWRRGGHGSPNVVESLVQSCDVFFYHAGLELGIDKIKKWSTLMGLGVKTGLDLGPEEVEGLIPSQQWREALMKKKYPDKPWEWRWYPGYTVNASIGQGEVNVTPLQNAVMMACILNGGRRVTPFLNMAAGPKVSEKFISDSTLALVQEGMRACVTRGTGKQAAIKGFDILGKTGTAQVVRQKQREKRKDEDIPYEERDHAWFVAGVLDHEPKLAICVLVEHGLHGASSAAPLARRVIEFFYSRKSEAPPAQAEAPPVELDSEGGEDPGSDAHWDVLPPDLTPESGEGAATSAVPPVAAIPAEGGAS